MSHTLTQTSEASIKNRKLKWSLGITIACYMSVAAFLYFDRHNGITELIHSLGTSGVIGAILMMALVCMTPLPSEGLLVMYLKVYGVLLGVLYGWIGLMLGSIGVFIIARSVGTKVIRSWISVEHFARIDKWIAAKGLIGLLTVRLLPIPALIVNGATGIMPSVSFWNYLWTGMIGIVPYYASISLMYFGFSRRDTLLWILGPTLVVGIAAYWGYRRRRC